MEIKWFLTQFILYHWKTFTDTIAHWSQIMACNMTRYYLMALVLKCAPKISVIKTLMLIEAENFRETSSDSDLK